MSASGNLFYVHPAVGVLCKVKYIFRENIAQEKCRGWVFHFSMCLSKAYVISAWSKRPQSGCVRHDTEWTGMYESRILDESNILLFFQYDGNFCLRVKTRDACASVLAPLQYSVCWTGRGEQKNSFEGSIRTPEWSIVGAAQLCFPLVSSLHQLKRLQKFTTPSSL